VNDFYLCSQKTAFSDCTVPFPKVFEHRMFGLETFWNIWNVSLFASSANDTGIHYIFLRLISYGRSLALYIIMRTYTKTFLKRKDFNIVKEGVLGAEIV
jgi:hypothetical protein